MPDSNDAVEVLENLGALVVDGKSGLLVTLDNESKLNEVIPLLQRLDNVVALEFLHHCDISDDHVKQIRNNPSIKKLKFNANPQLTEDAFSVLPTLGALEELSLKVHTDLDPEPVFKSIGGCIKLTTLTLRFPTSMTQHGTCGFSPNSLNSTCVVSYMIWIS